MRLYSYLVGTVGSIALFAALATEVPAAGDSLVAKVGGDAMRGRELYESRCTGCHSLDANRVGPMHRGVFGRRVGGVSDYPYSSALANSKLLLNAETLGQWLTDPQSFIPGQRMNVRVRDARDRADIIAFLKRESVEHSD